VLKQAKRIRRVVGGGHKEEVAVGRTGIGGLKGSLPMGLRGKYHTSHARKQVF